MKLFEAIRNYYVVNSHIKESGCMTLSGQTLHNNRELEWKHLDNEKFDVMIDIVHANAEWIPIMYSKPISDHIYENYADYLNWDAVSIYQNFIPNRIVDKYHDRLNWTYISRCKKHSMSFLEKYIDYIDFDEISINQNLSMEFIDKYADKLNWLSLSMYQHMSGAFLEQHIDYITDSCWNNISTYQELPKEFICKYADKLNWTALSRYQNIAYNDIISDYSDKIDWKNFSLCQTMDDSCVESIYDSGLSDFENLCKNLNADFSDKFVKARIKDKLINSENVADIINKNNSYECMDIIIKNVGKGKLIDLETNFDAAEALSKQILPSAFIVENKDYLHWDVINIFNLKQINYGIIEEKMKYMSNATIDYICNSIELPEQLIENTSNIINWSTVSIAQKLSESFIIKHKDDVYWTYISMYQKLSDKFLIDNAKYICWNQYIASHLTTLNKKVMYECCDYIDIPFIGKLMNFTKEDVEAMLAKTRKNKNGNKEYLKKLLKSFEETEKPEINKNVADEKIENVSFTTKAIDHIIEFLMKLRK